MKKHPQTAFLGNLLYTGNLAAGVQTKVHTVPPELSLHYSITGRFLRQGGTLSGGRKSLQQWTSLCASVIGKDISHGDSITQLPPLVKSEKA